MPSFRRRGRRLTPLVGVAVASVVAATATTPAQAAPAPVGAPSSQALDRLAHATGQAHSYDITLITGDTVHVTVSANGQYQTHTDLAPRPDGRQVTVTVLTGGGHTYVLPSDAADLVATGRVDRALFDVQQLIADGYANTRAGALPVIVQYPGQPARPATATPQLQANADALPASTPVRTLESINGVALSVTKESAVDFWAALAPAQARPKARINTLGAGLSRVWLDGRAHASLDVSVPMIGAPEAWAAGYDGTGVNVAILDTGIDATHPDLTDRIAASRTFVPGTDTVSDEFGHGTHVASTIAGSGAASDGKYRGVAPGAKLIIGKVLNDNGFGQDSWIIDAMEWATQTEHARIVSMSLGSGEPGDGTDPLSQAVNDLTASTGALFVIAAGNEGRNGARTVSSPGAADAALTVAAVDKSDQLADFSSRGPRITNYGLKPDIAAPGVTITAARAAGTDMGGGAVVVNQYYDTASGTSMATPHVAGSAAILLQEHPDWTQAQLKAALTSTARDDGYTVYQQGAGRVDVGAAAKATVLSETEKADFGRIRYPQTGPDITKPITYRNDSDQPVTLDLAATVKGTSGTAAPDGMFTVLPASLTVPAHGTAGGTVTVDPTVGPVGLYSGVVTATADGVSLRVPVGMYKEPEGYELTVTTTPPTDATASVLGPVVIKRVDTDTGQWITLPASGAVSVHLDKGVYSVTQTVAWKDHPGDYDNATFLANPQVDLGRDVSITLDADAAQKIDFDLDRPTEIYGSTMSAWRIPAGSTTPYGVVTDQLPYQVTSWATPTDRATVGTFLFEHNHVLGTPQITAEIPRHGRQPALVLHPRYQHYSAFIRKLDGRMRLPVVDVGSGSAAEFATVDVRGKIALVDIGDKVLFPSVGARFPFDELTRAADAGAAAVFAYGNTGTLVLGSVPAPRGDFPLPTVALPADEGAALHGRLASGAVTLRIDSEPTVPDIYSLFYVEQGAIPASLHRRVRDRALATVRPTYHASTPIAMTESWGVTRSPIFIPDSYSASFATVSLIDTPGPTTRTEHLGPVSGKAVWSRIVSSDDLATVFALGGPTISSSRNLVTTVALYDRPGFYREDFNQAPVVPGMVVPPPAAARQLEPTESGPTCAVCRYSGVFPGGDMLLLLTSAMDGDGHFGPPTSYSNNSTLPTDHVDEWHLYSGDTELPQFGLLGPGVLPFYVLPSDQAADYRMTEHYVDEFPVVDGFGTRADTTWTFHSAPPTGKGIADGYDQLQVCVDRCEVEPLLFLRYEFNLRLDNTLPAPGVHAFTVTAYHQPSESAMPRIAGLRMQASADDGRHWYPVLTIPAGNGTYRAFLVHPRISGDTGTISLRTDAWDTAGNHITQTLTDAYGLVSHHWWPRRAE